MLSIFIHWLSCSQMAYYFYCICKVVDIISIYFPTEDQCLVSTSSRLQSQKSNNTTPTIADTTSRANSLWVDSTSQYIMIGIGCGIGLLICIITTLCIGICVISAKSRNTTNIYVSRMKIKHNANQGN